MTRGDRGIEGDAEARSLEAVKRAYVEGEISEAELDEEIERVLTSTAEELRDRPRFEGLTTLR